MIRKPHAIFGPVKEMAGGEHPAGVDLQDGRFAVAAADGGGGVEVGGEMDLLAGLGFQALSPDGSEKTAGGAMVQKRWRLERRMPQIDLYRVPLGGADPFFVRREGESFLVVGCHHFEKLLAAEGLTGGPALGQEFGDVRPAVIIERKPDRKGFVAKDKAEEAADFGRFHGCSPKPRRLASRCRQC